MSDTIKSIGKIIEGTAEKDAIHVAVAPVIASHRLQAGQHVGLNKEGKATYAENVDYIGVVDPFLNAYVMPGDRFWLFLYPGSITSLRHQWSHPAFQEATEPSTAQETPSRDSRKEESEKWLRAYAAQYWDYTEPALRYDKMMSQIKSGTLTYEGTDMHGLYDLQEPDELRKHASIVLGYAVDWGEAEYFSCTC